MIGEQSLANLIMFGYFALSIAYLFFYKFKIKIPLIFLSCYGFFFLANLVYITFSVDTSLNDYFTKNILYLLYLIFTYVFFFQALKKKFNLRVIFYILLILATLFNIIDLFDEGSFFVQFPGFENRPSGFYVNANNSAYAILTCLSILISQSKKLSWYIFTIAMIGVLLTISRGGIFVWATLLLISFFNKNINRNNFIIALLVPIILSINLVVLNNLFLQNADNYNLISERLNFISGKSNSNAVYEDSRYNLVEKSFEVFSHSPIWGNGVFSLLRNGSDQLNHNQYLIILTDYGVVGFLVFICMLKTLYSKDNRIIFAFLLLSAFFTHEFLYSYTFLTIFAYLLATKSLNNKLIEA